MSTFYFSLAERRIPTDTPDFTRMPCQRKGGRRIYPGPETRGVTDSSGGEKGEQAGAGRSDGGGSGVAGAALNGTREAMKRVDSRVTAVRTKARREHGRKKVSMMTPCSRS